MVNKIDEAERSHCRRMLWLGLALAGKLLGAHLPERAREAIESDRIVADLVRRSEQWLRKGPAAPRSRLAEAQYTLRGGERFRDRAPMWRYFRERVFRPNEKDRAWLKLPRPLGFLYWLLRPLRLLRDYGFRRGNRSE